MASSLSRELCFTCGKAKGIFKCEGCVQVFCSKHSNEHRQKLHVQLDEVVQEQDRLFQDLTQENDRLDSFICKVESWKRKWIEKIEQAAENAKQEINNTARPIKEMLLEKSSLIKEQLVKAKEEDDFVEIDLTAWSQTLEQLRKDVLTHTQPSSQLNDPIKTLKEQMLGINSDSSDDDAKDFVSVAESFSEIPDDISQISTESRSAKLDQNHLSRKSQVRGHGYFRTSFRGRGRGRCNRGTARDFPQYQYGFGFDMENQNDYAPVYPRPREQSLSRSNKTRSSSTNRSLNRSKDLNEFD